MRAFSVGEFHLRLFVYKGFYNSEFDYEYLKCETLDSDHKVY